jgi:transcription initiation factor TFIID subunit 1
MFISKYLPENFNLISVGVQDRENIERLEITGVGDPSGRGLGFSYVRVAPKAPSSNSTHKKKSAAAKGTTVTGTDADLRRLSMDAAREVPSSIVIFTICYNIHRNIAWL